MAQPPPSRPDLEFLAILLRRALALPSRPEPAVLAIRPGSGLDLLAMERRPSHARLDPVGPHAASGSPDTYPGSVPYNTHADLRCSPGYPGCGFGVVVRRLIKRTQRIWPGFIRFLLT